MSDNAYKNCNPVLTHFALTYEDIWNYFKGGALAQCKKFEP